MVVLFFFNDTATTEIYTLSLHDALPILGAVWGIQAGWNSGVPSLPTNADADFDLPAGRYAVTVTLNPRYRDFFRRSEEHTSELQSRQYLVCRLLLEKKRGAYCI